MDVKENHNKQAKPGQANCSSLLQKATPAIEPLGFTTVPFPSSQCFNELATRSLGNIGCCIEIVYRLCCNQEPYMLLTKEVGK